MKKFLALALALVSFSVLAVGPDPDWSLTNTDGQVYTLLPQSVEQKFDKIPYTTGIVEYYENEKDTIPDRGRVGVSGCLAGEGRIVMKEIGGKERIFLNVSWVRDGERLYDMMALVVCGVPGMAKGPDGKPILPTAEPQKRRPQV